VSEVVWEVEEDCIYFCFICFIIKNVLRKKSDGRNINSAGDFVNFAEEGKKCGSEMIKEKRN